jgi:hypothetical protein
MNSCGIYKIIVLGAGATQHSAAIIGLFILINQAFFPPLKICMGFKSLRCLDPEDTINVVYQKKLSPFGDLP